MIDCNASVVCIYQKNSYYKLRIIFLYLKLVGETKSTKKGVHIHYLNSSHAHHATQNNVNKFLFESRSNT